MCYLHLDKQIQKEQCKKSKELDFLHAHAQHLPAYCMQEDKAFCTPNTKAFCTQRDVIHLNLRSLWGKKYTAGLMEAFHIAFLNRAQTSGYAKADDIITIFI